MNTQNIMMCIDMWWKQVADITCAWDTNSGGNNQELEGEFFPNISYIKYEVRSQEFWDGYLTHFVQLSSPAELFQVESNDWEHDVQGPSSRNPLAYKYYNAEELILGKKMKVRCFPLVTICLVRWIYTLAFFNPEWLNLRDYYKVGSCKLQ